MDISVIEKMEALYDERERLLEERRRLAWQEEQLKRKYQLLRKVIKGEGVFGHPQRDEAGNWYFGVFPHWEDDMPIEAMFK